jgi:hypothetical protein
MQTKGSKYTIFGTHQIPTNLHFASPLAKQNKSMKHKFSFLGETIVGLSPATSATLVFSCHR